MVKFSSPNTKQIDRLYDLSLILYNACAMTIQEIREKYLHYFEKHGHAILASSSLVPENDPTTLFTGSGMQPMIQFLLGESHPRGVRIADSQKCFRTQDIDEVGDNRHTTFFEMLGNWSLGDYFKQEQISWMFEFLTKELLLDPNRLYITVFRGNENISRDSESVARWKEEYQRVGIEAMDVDYSEQNGMQQGRIFYYDETKNWWSRSGVPNKMPVGEPGGPDTEMFWDFGIELNSHEQSKWKNKPCHVNCDCGRFVEIGNNVFMQYIKTKNGFSELPQKNVDFGGGLERLASAVINTPDLFLIDVFADAKKIIEQHVEKKYGENEKETFAFRVILDHIRAATFLIGDGVFPSNKDQGYFVRRLIRRAVRFSRSLTNDESKQQTPITRAVADSFIQKYKTAYPNLENQRDIVLDAIEIEENKFVQTIKQGLKELNRIIQSTGHLTGEDAFNLYQSFGFPLELTVEEIERNHGFAVDTDKFRIEFEKHKELSRAGAEQKFKGGLSDHSEMSTKYHTATHLLHASLRRVLGKDVEQKGSNITPERLRFDFSYPTKLSDEQIHQVENLVNDTIAKKLPVQCEMLTLVDAQKRNAIGLFKDKYSEVGDLVKVYFVGNPTDQNYFSSEVCGGPHVANTKELGKFRIQKEESVGSGLRRIRAILE